MTLPVGWEVADVYFRRTNGHIERRAEILHTGRYRSEPLNEIAFKCGALFFLVLPAYFIAYTAFHLIRLPIVTLANFSLKACIEQIRTLVRIPFYWIGLEMAALIGIFKPLEGRALFGSLEKDLHDGKKFQKATDFNTSLKFCWEMFSKKDVPYAFFMAPCMQQWGATKDPHIIFVRSSQPS